MAIAYNPSIVRSGLVFAYDMNNRKSFKGKPTTNLTTDTPFQNGWQGTYTLVDSNTKTFDITTQQNTSSTTSAWRTFYWAVTPGSTVTISMDVELVSENNATWLHYTVGQFNEGSFPANISGSLPDDAVQVTTKPSGKIHMTWSGVINATQPYVGITQWINNVTVDFANVVTRISNVQIEESAFETPFVNGTRSSAEAILDQTNNNMTINTSASLTYNSNNTFSFDGNDYIFQNSPNLETVSGSSDSTVIVWCKPNSATMATNTNYIGLVSWGQRTPNNPSTARVLSLNTIQATWYVSSAFWGNDYVPNDPNVYVEKDQWNMVAMIARGKATSNNVTLYSGNSTGVNSATGSSSISTNTLNTTNTSFAIGVTDYFGRFFSGDIAVVQIYSRELSDAEIKQNFNALRGRFGL